VAGTGAAVEEDNRTGAVTDGDDVELGARDVQHASVVARRAGRPYALTMASQLARLREGVGLLGLTLPVVVLTLFVFDAPGVAPLLACYVAAFVAVGAKWSWGRSFALGVAFFGAGLVWLLAKNGLWGQPIVTQIAVAHALVAAGLVRLERPRLLAFTAGWLLPSLFLWIGLR